jgi:hypothetical protein
MNRFYIFFLCIRFCFLFFVDYVMQLKEERLLLFANKLNKIHYLSKSLVALF